MILLLGGTSETGRIAEALADAGYSVLVSNCTDVSLDVGSGSAISLRTGALDLAGMLSLTDDRGITAIVDATHPYAVEVTQTARKVCDYAHLPYFRFERPGLSYDSNDIYLAGTHAEAAERACSFNKPILLTIGAGNLGPYVDLAREKKLPLFARVLDFDKSLEKCDSLGMGKKFVIAARGPFTMEDNRDLIRKLDIGVLVTKDSGKEGGVGEKLEAARMENCRVVVIKRPVDIGTETFQTTEKLVTAVKKDIDKRRL